MKQIMLMFLSLLTIFSISSPSFAQLREDEMVDTKTLMVREQLQYISGRIIKVTVAPTYTKVVNVCSGTLTDNQTVLTAAHCFKHKIKYFGLDKIKHALFKLRTTDYYYFDIPGITSHNLSSQIYNLTGTEGTSHKVPLKNRKKLNQILAKLPKIKKIIIPHEYLENMTPILAKPQTLKELKSYSRALREFKWNYKANAYDYSYVTLDKKIFLPNVRLPNIPIAKLASSDKTIYSAGFFGGSLSSPLQVFKCVHGASVLNDLQPKTDIHDFIRLKMASNNLIISKCDGEIIEGLSGGALVQLHNGNLSIVGLNSGVLFGQTMYVTSPILSNLVFRNIYSNMLAYHF